MSRGGPATVSRLSSTLIRSISEFDCRRLGFPTTAIDPVCELCAGELNSAPTWLADLNDHNGTAAMRV